MVYCIQLSIFQGDKIRGKVDRGNGSKTSPGTVVQLGRRVLLPGSFINKIKVCSGWFTFIWHSCVNACFCYLRNRCVWLGYVTWGTRYVLLGSVTWGHRCAWLGPLALCVSTVWLILASDTYSDAAILMKTI